MCPAIAWRPQMSANPEDRRRRVSGPCLSWFGWRPYAAEATAVETLVQTVPMLVPVVVTAATAMIETRPRISAYSTMSWPASSRAIRTKRFLTSSIALLLLLPDVPGHCLASSDERQSGGQAAPRFRAVPVLVRMATLRGGSNGGRGVSPDRFDAGTGRRHRGDGDDRNEAE